MIGFYKAIAMCSLVLLSNPVSAVDKITDTQRTEKGQLQGSPAPIEQTTSINFASNMLKSILTDQLQVTPESSKNYIFLGFAPGSLVENFCNGGSHVAFVAATWRNPPKPPLQWLTFEATLHELWLVDNPDRAGGQEAVHRDLNFSDHLAMEKFQKSWKWKALGKSSLKAQNFMDFNNIIDGKSDEYFDSAGIGGSNKDYHYLLRNCGSYLHTIVDQLEVEYGNMDDIVLAPPMMKREVSFVA